MVEPSVEIKESNCLNCGTEVSGNYCTNCGQKFQPTKVPIKLFLEDAVETLFNIDNRWLKTLKDLFFNPGKATKEYIEGKRAQYLPPLRIYLSISIVYFLLVQLSESSQVFFINFTDDEGEMGNIGTIIQYLLFFLVPIFAVLIKLFHKKRKGFYVEYLIFAFHVHTIWFVFLMIELFTVWLDTAYSQQWVKVVANIISAPAQLATFIYLLVYLKNVFDQGWLKAILKTFGIMILYLMTLAGFLALYYFILIDWFK
ncbi:MAG: hypothetical protein BalsKO_27630 [Balneolaceae bacterium]